jgi:hypothetical protein
MPCCKNGVELAVDIEVTTSYWATDEDYELLVNDGKYDTGANSSGPFYGGNGGYGWIQPTDVEPSTSEWRAEGQILICHEFGHMIGLDHPCPGCKDEYVTPYGESTTVGSPNDDIMGSGMAFHPKHFEQWRKAMNIERPKCKPYTTQVTNKRPKP